MGPNCWISLSTAVWSSWQSLVDSCVAGCRIIVERLRQRDGETEPVDAGDGAFLFADEEAPAVPFLLHPICGIGNEDVDALLLDGVEQLASDARGLARLVGLPVRRAIFAGGVALGGLFPDEFVVDGLGLFVGDRRLGVGAGVQRAATAAVREVDDMAAVLRFDARLIDFVGRAFAEVEGAVFHG